MTTVNDELSSGKVWMREDHHLVVTVPYSHNVLNGQPEKIVRHRLMEGLPQRWPAMEVPEGFRMKVAESPLEVMETDEPGTATVQIGVVLT